MYLHTFSTHIVYTHFVWFSFCEYLFFELLISLYSLVSYLCSIRLVKNHADQGKKWASSSRGPLPKQAQLDMCSHLSEYLSHFHSSHPPPPTHIQWFISLTQEKLFNDKFAFATIINGKHVNLKSFNYVFFHLEDWCKIQKWDKLVQYEKIIYPHLVHMLYTNLLDTHSSIESHVKEVKIFLTSSTLITILRIPRDEIQLTVCNT